MDQIRYHLSVDCLLNSSSGLHTLLSDVVKTRVGAKMVHANVAGFTNDLAESHWTKCCNAMTAILRRAQTRDDIHKHMSARARDGIDAALPSLILGPIGLAVVG